MVGLRVRVMVRDIPEEWGRDGVVIAENDDMLGVRLDKGIVPVIVQKDLTRALLT